MRDRPVIEEVEDTSNEGRVKPSHQQYSKFNLKYLSWNFNEGLKKRVNDLPVEEFYMHIRCFTFVRMLGGE